MLTDIITAISLALESALNGEFKGVFASVFFFLTFANLWSVIYQLRIRGWPTTSGRLLTANTEKFGVTETDPSDVNYTNVVSYQYTVGGQTYIGRRFSPWVVVASYNLKVILEKQLDGFGAGDSIRVLYNPTKPQNAFLKRPGVFGVLVTFSFALFCFATPMFAFG